jgi:hypothetical protein
MEHSVRTTASQTHRLPFRALVDLTSLLLILIPAVYIAIANVANTYDDAFITYRYAYNLATGQGFVYNPGEWYLGTTAPLYGLLLGVLGWINPEAIPLISGAISGLSLALCGVALYVYGRLHEQALCGLLAGLFFAACPLLFATFGGEMLFQAALILWAFVLYRLDRTIIAALLLALAVLTRADGAAALGVVGLHYVVTRRKLPWREMACVAIVLLPFALLAWVFYGSPLPATLDAKLAQRDSGMWPAFGEGMFEWIRAFTMQGTSEIFPGLPAAPNAIRFIGFVALGIPALLYFRFWLLPLAWIAIYLLVYLALDVPFYHWYIVPAALALMILAGCGVAGVIEGVVYLVGRVLRRTTNDERRTTNDEQPALSGAKGRTTNDERRTSAEDDGNVSSGLKPVPYSLFPVPFRSLLATLAVLALLPGIAAQIRDVQRLSLKPNPTEAQYEQTGRWLAENTPPDSSVGYFEIGYLGYYARRTLIDPLGLIDPTIAPHVATRDFTWAYEHYRPTYIIQNQRIFTEYIGQVVKKPWFQAEYRQVAVIEQSGIPPLIIYERQTQ